MTTAKKKPPPKKRQRKNMNLSLTVFSRLEKEKSYLEKRDGLQNMSWDVFFGLTLKELFNLRAGPQEIDQ